MNNFEFDLQYAPRGIIAGADEAGRGPLAGPVVVCAVVMPLKADLFIEKVDDSKRLSERMRNKLYGEITKCATEYTISAIDNDVIDKINILNAVKKGMTDCINRLVAPRIVLIDYIKPSGIKIPFESFVKGDALSYSVACASIIAKVTRDRLMCDLDLLYPQYGFSRHKGYGTKEHYEAINKYGPCRIHRKSFLRSISISEK